MPGPLPSTTTLHQAQGLRALRCAGREPVTAFTSRIRQRTLGTAAGDAAAGSARPAPRHAGPACPAYVQEDSRNNTPVVEFEECLQRHGRSLDVGVPDRHVPR